MADNNNDMSVEGELSGSAKRRSTDSRSFPRGETDQMYIINSVNDNNSENILCEARIENIRSTPSKVGGVSIYANENDQVVNKQYMGQPEIGQGNFPDVYQLLIQNQLMMQNLLHKQSTVGQTSTTGIQTVKRHASATVSRAHEESTSQLNDVQVASEKRQKKADDYQTALDKLFGDSEQSDDENNSNEDVETLYSDISSEEETSEAENEADNDSTQVTVKQDDNNNDLKDKLDPILSSL